MSVDDVRMSFTEHLGELRTRLIRASVAIVVSIFLCYLFSNFVIGLLAYPLTPLIEHGVVSEDLDTPVEPGAEGVLPGGDAANGEEATEPEQPAEEASSKGSRPIFTVFNPLEFIIVKIKIAAYCGILLSFPFVLWQVCAFIFPGLHPNERRGAKILILGCSILAVVGVLVAYMGVLPLVMPYLLMLIPADFVAVDQLRLSETITIIGLVLAAFAVAFQFPMVVLVLVYIGLLTPETLKRGRKIALIVMSIISAILTPADPISMLIMLIPLVMLYEISILMSHLVIWRQKSNEDAA